MSVFKLTATKSVYDLDETQAFRFLGFKFKEYKYHDSKLGYTISNEPEIKIESLEEILKIVEKFGAIVIEKSDQNDGPIYIEIYNGYRE